MRGDLSKAFTSATGEKFSGSNVRVIDALSWSKLDMMIDVSMEDAQVADGFTTIGCGLI